MKAEKSLKALQEALKEIAGKKPLVLFIDELDRCRPDFAVLMLETIKHTFDVEGVQFVLITNTEQLKASINHCYGSTIDAQRYLDKFLKFSFTLPHTTNESRHDVVLASSRHYEELVAQSAILKDLGIRSGICFDFVKTVISVNNLSLREVETVVRHLEIYQKISGDDFLERISVPYKLTTLLGVLLFSCKPELANAAVRNTLDAQDLGKFLGVDKLPEWNAGNPYPKHAEVLMAILGAECFKRGLFTPNEGQDTENWEGLIRDYFIPGHGVLAKGQRMKLLLDPLNVLSLKGH